MVTPDLSRWDWKDEDEYAHGRRLGVVREADHRAVEKAREEAVAMIEGGVGPFAAERGLGTWRYEPHWPDPQLPTGVLDLN
ncbi:hypothetical protein OG194_45860 [Streptomyces sp. NBC_01288]|uniref:hypothetical protein n=1 Tax=Streptomyces sp. NBC_01288 TaxID=2903814 RepID=UPI002E108911|nr:hypothetical protein OG194_45860 [Streptomyces sp. NBC_01288]